MKKIKNKLIRKKIYHSIILARGGSKGLKNKNLRKINNKPLIYWSIKKSLEAKKIIHTWVSSDSEKILNYSKKNGASIIKRPKKLAEDKSSSESAWLHGINYIKKRGYKIDNVVGIQPTSPIRSGKDFDGAIRNFEKNNLDSLFSSTIINDFFFWITNKKNKFISNYNYKHRKPRQYIKDRYLENGSFFIFNSKKFLKNKCRFFGKIGTFVMPKFKSYQIDDKEDLEIVSILSKKYLKNSK